MGGWADMSMTPVGHRGAGVCAYRKRDRIQKIQPSRTKEGERPMEIGGDVAQHAEDSPIWDGMCGIRANQEHLAQCLNYFARQGLEFTALEG